MIARYVEIVFRRRLRFTALFLISIGLSAYLLVSSANFRATATLNIEDPASFGATFVPIGWSPNMTPAQNVADSVIAVVRTPAFSQALSSTLLSSGVANTPQIVGSFATNLKVSVTGSHLLTLTYSCQHANLCVQVLSDMITVFRDQLIQTERDQAATTSTFWSGQLKDAQTSLASAQAALHSYASANPGVTVDATSTDPQVVQLLDGVRQWRAKVVEAQDNLSLAQYLSSSSARLVQVGTNAVDTPQLATPHIYGDGSGLLPAAIVMLAGLLMGLVYLVLLAFTDKAIWNAKLVERRLGVPVVTTIPRLVRSRG